ncbi:MAG: acyl-CoA synthetase FdrA [Promethearchaeota archaeon]
MTVVRTHLIRQEYRDSVQLMRAASTANKLEGVEIASVLMGTPKNKSLLEEVNLLTSEALNAGPNDIIISVQAETETSGTIAIQYIIDFLSQEVMSPTNGVTTYRSIRGALSGLVNANLAVISVPGEFAAREARLALEQNLNVFLFSDNVSIEDEVALKSYAHEKGLIIMGPDCGTGMIKNIGLGFANVVLPGPIGIVAASGTGTQEVMVLCHHRGVGVTHAIGTGSRDIKDIVGGISMIDGIHELDRDPSIKLIIVISKPPDDLTLQKILTEIQHCSKPVIINFLGKKAGYFDIPQKTLTVETLEEAALSASQYIQSKELQRIPVVFDDELKIKYLLTEAKSRLTSKQKYIRGLFAGGTFTYEAALIISNILPSSDSVWTNVRLKETKLIRNPKKSEEHTLIDMGADEFTVGKPHPMIDQTERIIRFLEEINDPETAVILIDFITGFSAHENPIANMRDAFSKWKAQTRRVPIVTHICGTELDPQDIKEIKSELRELGVYIMPTNAQAARLAALIATRGEII